MLVTNLQAGHPPFVHVRMVAIGDVKRAPPSDAPFVAVLEILQAVKVVQIPKNRGVLAVYFESVERLMPARITGGFKSRQRTVLETRQESTGIVNADLLDFARQRMF